MSEGYKKRTAGFPISHEAMLMALGLPDTARIMGFEFQPAQDRYVVYVDSRDESISFMGETFHAYQTLEGTTATWLCQEVGSYSTEERRVPRAWPTLNRDQLGLNDHPKNTGRSTPATKSNTTTQGKSLMSFLVKSKISPSTNA